MAAPLALGALLVLLRSRRALSAADRLRARRLLVCAMGGGEPQPLTRDMAAQAVHALLDELVAMGIPNADLAEIFNEGALGRTSPRGR